MTTKLSSKLDNLQDYVKQMRERFNVPALSVAILFDNKRYSAASGILNVNTGVTATTDSIFQIASITKVFTASLIMQLVDEGRLDLDAPVKQYLLNFRLADPLAADEITVSQLLNHTSGIPGDFISHNSYTEQNAISRYVDRCSTLSLVHAPGERYSYSNAGYNIAGRLIEVILGTTWFDAIEQRIFKPLGMSQAVAHPSQVIKHRAAIGHVIDANNKNKWVVSPDAYFPICWAPCGSVLTLSASDLITFAKTYLDNDRMLSRGDWLSEKSVNLMQQSQIKLPPYSPWHSTDCGIGWHLTCGNHPTVLGHCGVGPGQRSMLQIVPEMDLAIAALHNSSNPNVVPTLLSDILSELADIKLPDIRKKPGLIRASVLESLVGRYETVLSSFDVSLHKGGLRVIYTLFKQKLEPPECWQLSPVDRNIFQIGTEGSGNRQIISFLDVDQSGKANFIYYCGRLVPRI